MYKSRHTHTHTHTHMHAHEHDYKTEEIWIRSVDCINVNILAMILSYSFVRYYHWQKLDKGYIGPLCILNCVWIYTLIKIPVKKSILQVKNLWGSKICHPSIFGILIILSWLFSMKQQTKENLWKPSRSYLFVRNINIYKGNLHL